MKEVKLGDIVEHKPSGFRGEVVRIDMSGGLRKVRQPPTLDSKPTPYAIKPERVEVTVQNTLSSGDAKKFKIEELDPVEPPAA